MSDNPSIKGRLLVRMLYVQIVSVLTGGAMIYEITQYHFNPLIAGVCVLITGSLGLYAGLKYQVSFDESGQNLVSRSYGRLGWIILACYLVLRGAMNSVVDDIGASAHTAIGVSVSLGFGYVTGRWIGILQTIKRVKAERGIA